MYIIFLTVAPGIGNRIRLCAHPPAFLGLEKWKGREAPEGGRGVHQGYQEMRRDQKYLTTKHPQFCMKIQIVILYVKFETDVQGDHSGCFKPPVDTKTKIAF